MVMKKEKIMMMDEFHCFGAWEFVRGELLSFLLCKTFGVSV